MVTRGSSVWLLVPCTFDLRVESAYKVKHSLNSQALPRPVTHFLQQDSHLLLFYTILACKQLRTKGSVTGAHGDISHSNKAPTETKADVTGTVSEITAVWVCDLKTALPTSVFSEPSIACWFASEWEGGCEFSEGV